MAGSVSYAPASLVVLGVDGTFRTIPAVGILRGESFSFPPEPLSLYRRVFDLVGIRTLKTQPHSLNLNT